MHLDEPAFSFFTCPCCSVCVVGIFIFMRIPLVLVKFFIQPRIDDCVLSLRQFYLSEGVSVAQLSPQQQKLYCRAFNTRWFSEVD
jgi:hypothetical protein